MSQPPPSAQSVLSSVISTGKSNVRKVAAEDIRRFIQSQPNIVGQVTVSNARSNAEVGASSGIVLFTARYDTGSGPVERPLVLRHAPGSETRLFFEYDLARQFRVQKALQGTALPVPEPLWLDATGEYLGVQAYVMVAISGDVPHPSAFTKGPIADANPADRRLMLDGVLRALAELHRTDYSARGLGDFVMNASGELPIQKCVNWWWQSWEWFQQPSYARLTSVHRWLNDNAPAGRVALMHGDSTLHNYMFRGNKLVAVLDWEMSSLGRPEADIALQCVTNEIFAAPPGSGLLMPPSQAEWLDMYEKAGGQKIEHFAYFRKFATYMVLIAIVGLQRNLPVEVRAAQQSFVDRLWAILET